MEALEQIEQANVEQHRPPPQQPLTEAEKYAKWLDQARSGPTFTIPTEWLR